MLILVNHMDTEDQSLKKNRDTFQAIDVDYSGMISAEELIVTFNKLELKHEKSEDVVK